MRWKGRDPDLHKIIVILPNSDSGSEEVKKMPEKWFSAPQVHEINATSFEPLLK